ncbi:interleukin-6 [Hemibagrus wyckioides]|uniref:interleukin-6 n=1 Tax=Hemibagrus wyckioides TaxID=337641 RepID=UPI00266BEF98|nr:interleukin-6 [Hemibagrus wyckioides]
MPSLLHSLFLLALALFPLHALGLYSGDSFETSGGEVQNEAHAPDHKWHSIAKQLWTDIANARKEQFIKAGMDNNTSFEEISIYTPLLNASDGCLPVGFHAQKCLRRIYSGLRVYQVYLLYIEQENWFISNLVNIKEGTTRLLHLIKETVNVNDEKFSPSDLSEFTDSAWIRQKISQFILRNFTKFMVPASRAINHMKNRKLLKHSKEEEQFLKHHQ